VFSFLKKNNPSNPLSLYRRDIMNKYVLMLAAAGLIAAAPAYYAFQAQAEEKAPAAGEQAAIDCTNIPEGAEVPAECTDKAAPSAGEQAAPAGEAEKGTNE
jgi:hypothetical protein